MCGGQPFGFLKGRRFARLLPTRMNTHRPRFSAFPLVGTLLWATGLGSLGAEAQAPARTNRWEKDIRAFEEIDRLSIKLLGVYHSHPNHPCYPSGLDIRRAFYPDTAFFIISLADYHHPQIKAFTIREGTVMEEEIIIR